MNKALHTAGAGLLHLLCAMAVDLHRKRRCVVAEVALQGLEIVSGLQ